jgi:hypothetical protein
MDDEIADLILEHGEAIFPYLELRARYFKEGSKGRIPVSENPNLQLMERSGFIELEKNGDKLLAVLYNTPDRWLYQPKEKQRKTKEKEEYIPKELEKIAELIGYPDDWFKNPGKYRSLWFTARGKHSEMINIAEKVKEKEIQVELQVFLSFAGFNSIKKIVNKNAFQDRVQSADYSEDQLF